MNKELVRILSTLTGMALLAAGTHTLYGDTGALLAVGVCLFVLSAVSKS
jgi:hypothetical protein